MSTRSVMIKMTIVFVLSAMLISCVSTSMRSANKSMNDGAMELAYYKYKELLTSDPQNAEAREGLQACRKAIVEQALTEANNIVESTPQVKISVLEKAIDILDKASAFDPDGTMLMAAKEEYRNRIYRTIQEYTARQMKVTKMASQPTKPVKPEPITNLFQPKSEPVVEPEPMPEPAAPAETVDMPMDNAMATSSLSGKLICIGSDTMRTIIEKCGVSFKEMHPNVVLHIQSAGSGTAPPALIDGTANIGLMSRLIKDKEVEAFEAKMGYKPTKVVVAIDCLAVYINKDNPCKGLTLPQLDSMFSKTRERRHPIEIRTWGDAGLTDGMADKQVTTYGRNLASGTYAVFKSIVLKKGDYSEMYNAMEDSVAVISMVGADLGGIGYSGMGYKTDAVHFLPVAVDEGYDYIEPSFENAMNGSYPISRTLNIYVNKQPNQPLPEVEREFIKFILSDEGQKIVKEDNYGPIPLEARAKSIADLE